MLAIGEDMIRLTRTAGLRTIGARETALITMLFDAPAVACETELARTLGQAP